MPMTKYMLASPCCSCSDTNWNSRQLFIAWPPIQIRDLTIGGFLQTIGCKLISGFQF
jgi:hypothetical protein